MFGATVPVTVLRVEGGDDPDPLDQASDVPSDAINEAPESADAVVDGPAPSVCLEALKSEIESAERQRRPQTSTTFGLGPQLSAGIG